MIPFPLRRPAARVSLAHAPRLVFACLLAGAAGFTGVVLFVHTVLDSAGDSMDGAIGVHVTTPETAPIAPALAIVRASGEFVLRFTGTAGLEYTRQHSDDLSDWMNFDAIVASGALQSMDVPLC